METDKKGNVDKNLVTPGPWKVKGVHLGTSDPRPFRAEWIEPNICEMVSSRPPDEVAANAAFIVQAVNSHDALTAALDGAVEALTNLVSLDDGDERLFWQGNGELFANAARAALAQAKKARE